MPTHVIPDLIKSKIYAGHMFNINASFNMTAGQVIGLLIAPVNAHITGISIFTDASSIKAEFFESPGPNVIGAAITPSNYNRNAINNVTPQSKFNAPTTFNSNGLLLDSITVFGPETTSNFGNNNDLEWFTREFESYAILITNNNPGSAVVKFGLAFYEDFL